MKKFRYTARDKEAHLISGTLEANDPTAVVKELRQRELTIVSVTEEKEEEKKAVRVTVGGRGRVKPMDLVVFSRQLATFIDAGISLVMSLTLLYEQVENKYLKKLINDIKNDLEAGNSLSSAFAKYSDFPPIFANMIKAGESSGGLNEILERLADYLEGIESLKRKIRAASVYPSVVVSMALLINVFLMIKVVPTFKGIFMQLNAQLPLPTMILITASNLTVRYFPFMAVGIVVTAIGFSRYINSRQGRIWFDNLKLRLPIVGQIIRKIAIGRFTRTLATLVKSGVSILDAFEIAGKVSGNKIIEMATEQIRVNIRAGETIAVPMAETGRFPNFVVKMIAVGEETGELEKMLTKISDYYEEQVNESLGQLTASLEPMIIVFLGVTIGYVVVSMFLPIFKLTQLVAR